MGSESSTGSSLVMMNASCMRLHRGQGIERDLALAVSLLLHDLERVQEQDPDQAQGGLGHQHLGLGEGAVHQGQGPGVVEVRVGHHDRVQPAEIRGPGQVWQPVLGGRAHAHPGVHKDPSPCSLNQDAAGTDLVGTTQEVQPHGSSR